VPVNRKLFCLMLEHCLISLYRITKVGIVSHTHKTDRSASSLFSWLFFKKDGENNRRGGEELEKKKV
jgi:hypothetical protein